MRVQWFAGLGLAAAVCIGCGSESGGGGADAVDTQVSEDTTGGDTAGGSDATDTVVGDTTEAEPCESVSPGACAGHSQGDSFCADDVAVTCGLNGDGCLVETASDDCGAAHELCDAGACVPRPGDACSAAIVVDGSYTATGDETSDDFSDRSTGGEGCTSVGGPEAVFEVGLGAKQFLVFESGGSLPATLQLQRACGAAEPCLASQEQQVTWFEGADTTLYATAELRAGTDYALGVQTLDPPDLGALSVTATPAIDEELLLQEGQIAVYVFEVVDRPLDVTITATSESGFPGLSVTAPGNRAIPSERFAKTRAVLDPGLYLLGVMAAPGLGDVTGFTVTFTATPTAVCGDGLVEPGESCDDGETDGGDGCSAECEAEVGFACDGEPSSCTGPDDLGLLAPGGSIGLTTTDVLSSGAFATYTFHVDVPLILSGTASASVGDIDLYINAADGEPLFQSASAGDETVAPRLFAPGHYVLAVSAWDGAPDLGAGYSFQLSAAATSCGDGAITGLEACDDGDADAGDGCSAICAVEYGWRCEGAPSTCSGPVATGLAAVGDTYAASVEAALTAGANRYYALTTTEPAILVVSATSATADVDVGVTPRSGTPFIATATQDGDESLETPTLEPGDYIVLVNAYTAGDGFTLDLELAAPPTCGDGQVESEEQCDDGNAVSGDGCSGTDAPGGACQREDGFDCGAPGAACVPWELAGYLYDGQTVTISSEQTLPTLERETYIVEVVEGPLAVAVEAVVDGGVARLFDADTGALRREILTGSHELLVPLGRYLIEMEAGEAAVEGYSLTLTASTPGVCGDGTVDTVLGETCDDGHLPDPAVDGDGCSATCQVEFTYTCAGEPSVCSGPEDIGEYAVGGSLQVERTEPLEDGAWAYYTFRLNDPARLSGTATAPSGDIDLGITVDDGIQSFDWASAVPGDETFDLGPLPPGEYLLAFNAWEAVPSFMFEASVDAVACGAVTYEGCCSDANVVIFCDNGQLAGGICASPSCGWDSANAYYSCQSDADADPSATHPRACPALQ